MGLAEEESVCAGRIVAVEEGDIDEANLGGPSPAFPGIPGGLGNDEIVEV